MNEGGYALLDSLPLLVIGVSLVAGFMLASELGHRVQRRFGRAAAAARKGSKEKDEETADEGQVLGTALLLLALLLGFTFSIALSRYDARRVLVVKEANDIGTAWLRAGLVGNPAGHALQDKLRDYAATRVAQGEGAVAYAALRTRGSALRNQIWALTAAATAPERSTAQSASLVAAVNSVIDTASEREAELDARVPARVITLLIVYSAVSAFLLGYVLGGYGARHRPVTLLLFVLLAMTIDLILDLDRPQAGSIRISQGAMTALVADLSRPSPPAAAVRP